MNSGLGYKYSLGDLLENPEKYEYSEYQGSKFLDIYHHSRTNAIELLNEKIKRIEQGHPEGETPHPWVVPFGLDGEASWFFHKELPTRSPDPGTNAQLETRKFLCQSINAAIIDRAAIEVKEHREVFNLVRRFEISKKVHDFYTLPNFRPVGDPSKHVTNYGLLGTLLATLCPSMAPEQQLILFNSLLKVNDILVSVRARFRTPVEHYMSVVSLRKEREIFQVLRRKYAC